MQEGSGCRGFWKNATHLSKSTFPFLTKRLVFVYKRLIFWFFGWRQPQWQHRLRCSRRRAKIRCLFGGPATFLGPLGDPFLVFLGICSGKLFFFVSQLQAQNEPRSSELTFSAVHFGSFWVFFENCNTFFCHFLASAQLISSIARPESNFFIFFSSTVFGGRSEAEEIPKVHFFRRKRRRRFGIFAFCKNALPAKNPSSFLLCVAKEQKTNNEKS